MLSALPPHPFVSVIKVHISGGLYINFHGIAELLET